MATRSRRFFRIRFLLLLIPLGILGAFVWQLAVIPPDPVFQGHRLSWWLRYQRDSITAKDLRAMSPAAAQWLAYAAEHGRHPDNRRRPRHEVEIRYWECVDWSRATLGLEANTYDERREALSMLNKMGPEAAPAVPALVRILLEETDGYGVAAADGLIQSGPVGKPLVLQSLANGPEAVRVCLIMNLPHYGATREANVEYLVAACHDPDPKVRFRALQGLKDYGARSGFSADMEPAIPFAAELLTERNAVEPFSVLFLLGSFGEHAAPSVPQLIQFLKDPKSESPDRMFAWLILAEVRRAGRMTPEWWAMLESALHGDKEAAGQTPPAPKKFSDP